MDLDCWNRHRPWSSILDQKMTVAFRGVYKMSERENVYMRDAAYIVAIDRVVKAMELRGWL